MRKKTMQIDHFSHEHPLVLTMELSKNGKGFPCPACHVPVLSGPAYMCNKCRVFMHKSCAELPTTINHFKHPQHPLRLIKKSPYGSRGSVCDNCHERNYGFTYHCEVETCNFDLDIVCGSLQLIVEDHVHDHSYILFRPIAFVCDVCGQSSKCKPIVCTSCQVIAHTDCASVPHVVNIQLHVHPLKTAYSNQQASVCKLCQGEIKTNILYKCVHCPDYSTHVFCSLSVICEDNYVQDVEEENDPVYEENSLWEEPNSVFSLLCSDSHNVEDKEIIFEDDKVVPGIDHFSHSHPLTYIQEDLQHNKICNACTRRISGPHYKCSECELFLHKLCAELPISIQHPLHSQHPLSLLSKHPLLYGFFTCACCRKQYNGYTYMCDECDFSLDFVCGSLTGTLMHDSHMHSLNYVREESDAKCKACGKRCDWEKYRCSDCEFNLHPKCAALPPTAWHKWDDQPLELTFGSAKNQLGELSGAICEKERGKDLWFYSCSDQGCGHSAHPNCILDDFTGVELGRTYKSPSHLPHDLTLIEGNTEETHNTDASSDLTCSECDLDIHVKSLSPDSQQTSTPKSIMAASSSSTRKVNVYKAKLAEQAGHYEEMVSFMQRVASALDSGELTAEERNLLYVACKKVISTRRASWRIISAMRQKEENLGNEDQVSIKSDYKIKIEPELLSIIETILNLLDSRLIPSAIAGDSKVFYLKMKGDYHRYMAEIKNGVEKNVAAESTLSVYKEAWDIANVELPPINPIRLGLALNFSVFYYEIMNSPDDAYKLARKAFDEAIVKLDIIQDQAYKDCTLIMHLLHDNLTLWTSNMKKNGLMTKKVPEGEDRCLLTTESFLLFNGTFRVFVNLCSSEFSETISIVPFECLINLLLSNSSETTTST